MATNPLVQIGWDSCVIIDFLQRTAGRVEFLLPIATDAQAKKLIIVVSTMAMAEVFRLDDTKPDQAQTITDFFERPFVHREAVGVSVAERARDIRRKHSVDGADAIHLATAIATNTPYFLTTDGVAKRHKKPLLILDKLLSLDNGAPLRILTPESYENEQRDKVLKLQALTREQLVIEAPKGGVPNGEI